MYYVFIFYSLIGYTYLNIGSSECALPTTGCHTMSGNVSGIQVFSMRLGLAVPRTHYTGDYRQVFARMASPSVCGGELGDN